jgi:hypothetical protein
MKTAFYEWKTHCTTEKEKETEVNRSLMWDT